MQTSPSRFTFGMILIAALLLSGCSSAPAEPTSTLPAPSQTQPVPTSTASFTPTASPTLTASATATFTPRPTSSTPTITAPAPRETPLELPDGLEIEEYPVTSGAYYSTLSQIEDRLGNPSRLLYWEQELVIRNKPMVLEETYIPSNRAAPIEIFTVFIDSEEVYQFGCGVAGPLNPIISTWTSNDHWYIQTYCNDRFTVFSDGMPIDLILDYQSSYAFQLLDDKPLYLFTRNDQVWLFYDDTEVLLGYDEVLLHYCCEGPPSPFHYENMIFFIARTGEQYYAVAIGKFSEEASP